VAARIIGTGAGGNIKVVILDRGTNAGVKRGMAVLTSDGVVGRVVEVYSAASTVLLLTDASFAAGVVSQKNRVSGILRGTGRGTCVIDYVPNEQKVESGEWFYTTGDDRVFPRGLPVGTVTTAQPGRIFKDVVLAPSGLSKGLEEVLVVLEGVHQSVPEYVQEPAPGVSLLPPPPGEQTQVPGSAPGGEGAALGTEADRLREQYRRIGEAQGHVFGEGSPGSKPPDFNLKPGAQPGPTPAPPSAGAPSKGLAPTAPPGAVKPSQTAPP
jgi:rod shape-determining protein MreC